MIFQIEKSKCLLSKNCIKRSESKSAAYVIRHWFDNNLGDVLYRIVSDDVNHFQAEYARGAHKHTREQRERTQPINDESSSFLWL